ncbi:MAG: efflux RND transporter periplasmic adaptor subunit [Candidatus Binatia bacterium]|nr:efflux RND transporter periplasmic adaptor subunit [Candidatus Binatia bacterium]
MREIFALLLVVSMGCGGGGSTSVGTGAGLPRIVTTRPAVEDVAVAYILPGSLEPQEMAALYARVTGYLESVDVDIGDEVKAGDPLARILVPEMDADVQRAHAEVKSRAAEVEIAGITRRRLESLRRREKDAVASQDVDTAAAQEQMAIAGLARAEASAARLNRLAEFSVVRAPFDGRISRRILHTGALIREGSTPGAEPVVEIVRTDSLRLVFDVPEKIVPSLKVGQPVRITLDAFPGEELEDTVTRTAGALDPRTRSMRAEVDITDATLGLEPGMFAQVHLGLTTREGALVLPSRAVRGQGSDRHVLVVENGALVRRPVAVASDDGRRAVVASGLAAGDNVMLSGSPLAREGAAVDVAETPSE